MWPFSLLRRRKSDAYRKRRWVELYRTLVPPLGESETWQGEVLRIISNAEDEANRNGFANWDEEDNRDLDLFVERLCGDATFDPVTKGKIKGFAEEIKRAGINSTLRLPNRALWSFLHFRAVDWCDAHPEPIPTREGNEYVGHF
jgi:hypothetical protein